MNTAQLPSRLISITKGNLLLLLLLILVIPLVSTGTARSMTFGAAERTLEIDFSFDAPVDPTKQLAGYRLYKEGVQVCTTNQPSLTKMGCTLLTEDGSFDFTLKAYYSDNTESLPSPSYPFVVSSTHSVDFTWQAVAGADNQGGFRLYDNGVLVQTITDPAARQLTYTSEFSSAAHTFTIAAVNGSGVEKVLPDALTSNEIYPPTAELTSSTGAGNAPLTVNFNGSSSTATNLPLVKYSWVFGDGSQATGAAVSHVFTAAGTYYTQLTVEDSRGLTDTVTTPIVVGQATVNQKPTAVIAVTQGGAPLTYSFNGSQSSDPDGSIVKHDWNFGDGTTGSGATTQHTYASQGNYTVTLQVTDNRGATATATKQIQSGTALPIEVGEVSINHEWVKVLFENPFTNPVVIAGPTTVNEDEPVTVRIRNIDGKGFEIRLQEWDYQNRTHAPETVNYMVMEKGVHTLANGTKVEAGTITASTSLKQFSLQQSYNLIPVVLTQVVTENEADAVTCRVRSVKRASFEFKLQEMERTATAHIPENIGYIALEPGKGEISGFLYEVGATARSINQYWSNISFGTQFPEQPAFFAGMQTAWGGDTATVRSKDLSATAAKVKIEEEQSKDQEVRHDREVVGYLVIGAATTAQP